MKITNLIKNQTGLKIEKKIGNRTYLWPLNVDSSAPVSIFQSLMVLSLEQLARTFVVGWNATPFTILPKFLEVST